VKNVVMLLSNPFRPDPRVLKEACSLADAGYNLTIIAWDRQAEYSSHQSIAPNLQVIRIQDVPSSYGIGARQVRPLVHFWWAALRRLEKLSPDLLHCHDFDTLPAGLWGGKLLHVPVIYDAHEYYADFVQPRLSRYSSRLYLMAIRNFERLCAQRAAAIITVDETLAGRYRPINNNVLVIGHYPSRSLVPLPAQIFTHPELGLLYLGRLSRDRGLNVYLDIIRQLHATGVPARLVLAGVFTPARERDAFLSAAHDLQNSIQILDWLPYERISNVLTQVDVGLALLQPEPRYIAALPVKLFEYMAAGLPILLSDFPAVRQVVAHAHCGALLDPGDSQAAVAQLLEWRKNPDLARRMGANGRQAVLNEYNWESLAEGLNRLYSNLLS
jgi:glycosyltransferase involved in cell wall biosynthesis